MNVIPAASYSRYSTNMQDQSSIDNQQRKSDERAVSESARINKHYSDAAISGSILPAFRPGCSEMLKDALDGKFKMLFIESLDRLSRDPMHLEQLIRVLEFNEIIIIGVSDGYDSRLKTCKITRGIRGLINQVYIDDVREKTTRTMEGIALLGASAGGRTYGYTSVSSNDGKRKYKVIDPEKATIVVRIFERYAGGSTPFQIADELNAEGIPSPRGGTWARSAIYGDKRAGVGILNNPLYIGEEIWNRSTWKKDPESGKRRRFENPREEWIIHNKPELRIINEDLWNRVQERLNHCSERGQPISKALQARNSKGGRKARHLLSGIMKCGDCGGNLVIVDRYRYGCSTHKERGPHVCPNAIKVPKQQAEATLLEGVKSALLDDKKLLDEFIKEVKKQAKAAARAGAGSAETAKDALSRLEKKLSNFWDAMGEFGSSETLKKKIATAEAEKSRLEDQLALSDPADTTDLTIPSPEELRSHYRRLIDDLEGTLGRSSTQARELLKQIFKEVTVLPDASGKHLEAQCQITLVAGAGFEPTTFGL